MTKETRPTWGRFLDSKLHENFIFSVENVFSRKQNLHGRRILLGVSRNIAPGFLSVNLSFINTSNLNAYFVYEKNVYKNIHFEYNT